MKPILTVHASAGSGHRSAALAINQALAGRGHQAILADILSFAGPGFRTLYGRGYEFSSQYLRWLCRLVYSLTDSPAGESRLVEFIEANHAAKVAGLGVFLAENQIETVCCTHFLPLRLVADLRRAGRFGGRLEVCVTDYQVHGFWLDPDVDRYHVATPEAAKRLLAWGVPVGRIEVSGIPVRQGFAPGGGREGDDAPWRVLLMGSSLKIREVMSCLDDLAALKRPMNLTIVTGRNQSLFQALSNDYHAPSQLNIDLRGLEPHMEQIMPASDFMVTKPGGIICSEALCAGLPMLFVSPIPNHEVYNAQSLAEAGAGLICFGTQRLLSALEQVAENPARLTAMRQAALKLARPNAADDIATALLGG